MHISLLGALAIAIVTVAGTTAMVYYSYVTVIHLIEDNNDRPRY